MPSARLPANAARRSAAVYLWGFGLALVILGLLVFNDRQCMFGVPIYETGDWASNSLFVRETKLHPVIHGHYSRWNFYHPGPILFYVYAAGEIVFHDWLHVVPAPYNGQMIGICTALTLLFSFALTIFAQRLGGRRGGYAFFLPLALMFAVWHYGALSMIQPFTATWPASPPVLVFLCFIVATASVASGVGRELPLVAFTGGWLVQNYVAQPLFVVPMTLLAYFGLLFSCRAANRTAAPAERPALLTAGWRASPRAHLVAAGVLALFILPLLVDVLHGGSSNFNRILDHLRQEHEPMHKFVRSLCYFVTFGSYAQYDPTTPFFGRYSAGGMLTFAALHWRAYLCWVTALLATPLLLAVARQTASAAPSAAAEPEAVPATEKRDTFLGWFGVMTAVAFGLTLFWGMKQDGFMFYFNAYFNFSIFFCAALGLAAALAAFLQTITAAPHLRRARTLVSAALVLGAGTAAFSSAGSFANSPSGAPGPALIVKVATAAATETLRPGQCCYLDPATDDLWPLTIGVALQLDRLGYKVRVNDNWHIMYGDERAFSYDADDFSQPVVHWRVQPITENPAQAGRWPLQPPYGVDTMALADMDPAGGKIVFTAGGNWEQCAFVGWAAPGEWVWADQPVGLVEFHPLPLPTDDTAGVDMLIDALSLVAPQGTTPQRVEIVFDGAVLPAVTLPLPGHDGPFPVRVSAELWRAACAKGFAKILFRYPDARSPYKLGLNGDKRYIGGSFRSIAFRLAR